MALVNQIFNLQIIKLSKAYSFFYTKQSRHVIEAIF